MHPENIIIVGPTSSGKSDLAGIIASHLNIPVFSCDAIQIYKELNLLSNKPIFHSQKLEDCEVKSYIKTGLVLDFPSYHNFEFKIIRRKEGKFIINKSLDSQDFFRWLVLLDLIEDKVEVNNKVFENYLFDIKNYTESYSSSEFASDVNRITKKQNLTSKIIAGGTIYYAYHYIFGTEFNNNENQVLIHEPMELEDIITFLSKNDPKTLVLLDVKNKQRLEKAIAFIKSTGNKFSEHYHKKTNILNDFLLIAIVPKSREEYVNRLEKVVKKRIDNEALVEIHSLKIKYGETISEWLKSISYEYRYGVLIQELLSENTELSIESPRITNLIAELQIKERQYTKRQCIFIKKLLRDLSEKEVLGQ